MTVDDLPYECGWCGSEFSTTAEPVVCPDCGPDAPVYWSGGVVPVVGRRAATRQDTT